MKRIPYYVIIKILIIFLLACVPTPDTDVVVQKDTTHMLEMAKNNKENDLLLAESLGIPKGKYSFSTSAVEDRLAISVNAEVHVPNTTGMPIYKVRKARFSQGLLNQVVTFFFKDEIIYDMSLPDESTYNGKLNQEGLYYHLDLINRTSSELKAGLSYKAISAWASATDEALLQNDSDSISFLSYQEGKGFNYFGTAGCRADYNSDSFQKAKDYCDSFFLELGLDSDYSFGFASQILGSSSYRLFYTHKVNGIDTFISTEHLDVSDRAGYSIPWGYETIMFAADRDGINEMHWYNPITVNETVMESTSLLSFREVVTRFESMVKIKYSVTTSDYGGTTGTMDVTIDEIHLCLMRIREQNAKDASGLLIPVWVFYGNSKLIESDGTVSYNIRDGHSYSIQEDPYPVIIINAIDGSVVDFREGY